MGTFYRNRTTGRVQSHPQSGIGDSLNSDEIGQDGKPVKPRTSLAPSKAELKSAKALLKDHTATPIEVAANAAVVAKAAKTTEAKTGTGDSTQEGDQ